MEINELKGKIIAGYGRQYKFATYVEMTESKVSMVLSGRSKLESTEARIWEKALNLKRGGLKELEADK